MSTETTTSATGVDIDAIRPATDLLLANLRETLGQVREHDHPASGGDLFCLNLTSYMGDRMGPVLRRLADEQAETKKWRERHTALADEFTAEADRLHAKIAALTAELKRARADERNTIAADIENMGNNLGDAGWKHIERKAVEAGYPAEIVRRRRTRDDFTTDTIEAAYQYGYRQAAKVARGEVDR